MAFSETPRESAPRQTPAVRLPLNAHRSTSYERAYVRALIPEYNAVLPRIPNEQFRQRMVRDMDGLRETYRPAWDDIAHLESALVEYLQPDELRIKAQRLRDLYRDLAPTPPLTPPAPQPFSQEQLSHEQLDTLRADVRELLAQLYLQISIKRRREQLRSFISWLLGIPLLLVMCGTAWFLADTLNVRPQRTPPIPPANRSTGARDASVYFPAASLPQAELVLQTTPARPSGNEPGASDKPGETKPTGTNPNIPKPDSPKTGSARTPATGKAGESNLTPARVDGPLERGVTARLLLLSLLMGLIGGLVSVMRRAQARTTQDTSYATLIELEYGWVSVLGVPILGAIFAGLLFFVFVGGFLHGGLFPTFVMIKPSSNTTDLGLLRFFREIQACDPENASKLLVWSFLAGFVEQLVPDALDRIAGQIKK